MKNIIIVTGGAGFIGSNLIEKLINIKNFYIISLDNYSSGSKSNHVIGPGIKVKYLNGDTKDVFKILGKYSKKIHSIFHFGEFSRIYQSFKNSDMCFNSNIAGTGQLISFALKNRIKLIYSATSASLGNKGADMSLSPYAFTKAKNLELLENLKKWFDFKYEVIYFYNVYGPKQICSGEMATVVGIFQEYYKNKKPLPVVKPGTQSRRFTHVEDTISACIIAWKNNMKKHYSVVSNKSYSIIMLAKLFKSKIKYLPSRKGERFSSALTRVNLNNKIIRLKAKTKLEDYVENFLNKSA